MGSRRQIKALPILCTAAALALGMALPVSARANEPVTAPPPAPPSGCAAGEGTERRCGPADDERNQPAPTATPAPTQQAAAEVRQRIDQTWRDALENKSYATDPEKMRKICSSSQMARITYDEEQGKSTCMAQLKALEERTRQAKLSEDARAMQVANSSASRATKAQQDEYNKALARMSQMGVQQKQAAARELRELSQFFMQQAQATADLIKNLNGQQAAIDTVARSAPEALNERSFGANFQNLQTPTGPVSYQGQITADYGFDGTQNVGQYRQQLPEIIGEQRNVQMLLQTQGNAFRDLSNLYTQDASNLAGSSQLIARTAGNLSSAVSPEAAGGLAGFLGLMKGMQGGSSGSSSSGASGFSGASTGATRFEPGTSSLSAGGSGPKLASTGSSSNTTSRGDSSGTRSLASFGNSSSGASASSGRRASGNLSGRSSASRTSAAGSSGSSLSGTSSARAAVGGVHGAGALQGVGSLDDNARRAALGQQPQNAAENSADIQGMMQAMLESINGGPVQDPGRPGEGQVASEQGAAEEGIGSAEEPLFDRVRGSIARAQEKGNLLKGLDTQL